MRKLLVLLVTLAMFNCSKDEQDICGLYEGTYSNTIISDGVRYTDYYVTLSGVNVQVSKQEQERVNRHHSVGEQLCENVHFEPSNVTEESATEDNGKIYIGYFLGSETFYDAQGNFLYKKGYAKNSDGSKVFFTKSTNFFWQKDCSRLRVFRNLDSIEPYYGLMDCDN